MTIIQGARRAWRACGVVVLGLLAACAHRPSLNGAEQSIAHYGEVQRVDLYNELVPSGSSTAIDLSGCAAAMSGPQGSDSKIRECIGKAYQAFEANPNQDDLKMRRNLIFSHLIAASETRAASSSRI